MHGDFKVLVHRHEYQRRAEKAQLNNPDKSPLKPRNEHEWNGQHVMDTVCAKRYTFTRAFTRIRNCSKEMLDIGMAMT